MAKAVGWPFVWTVVLHLSCCLVSAADVMGSVCVRASGGCSEAERLPLARLAVMGARPDDRGSSEAEAQGLRLDSGEATEKH